jgi:hypothetical protein
MYNPYSIEMIPVRIRSVGHFTASNPWSGDARAEWSIETYRMVQERYAGLVAKNPVGRAANLVASKGEAFGIRSEADGRYHILPAILVQFWHENQVDATQLPRLLRAIEPELKRGDYPPFSDATAGRKLHKWLCSILLGLGVVMLGLYVFVVPPASHSYRNITLQDWLSRPVRNVEALSVDGTVNIEGILGVPSPVHASGGVSDNGYSAGSVVGWFKAPEGHRLVLIPHVFKGDNPLRLSGTVLKTSSIGLPPAVLQSIASTVPDIRMDYIFCDYWQWADGYNGWTETGPVWLCGGLVFAAMGVLFYLLASWGDRRRLEHRTYVLSRLRGLYA